VNRPAVRQEALLGRCDRQRWVQAPLQRHVIQIEAICRGTRCDSKWRRRISRAFLIGNRLSGNMFSFDFRKTPAWDYQRPLLRLNPRNTVPFHVGTQFHSMWAPITVKQQMLPTSERNRCPHQTKTGAHIEWNHLPTSTGIRSWSRQDRCIPLLVSDEDLFWISGSR
jgi:hypothetical protein